MRCCEVAFGLLEIRPGWASPGHGPKCAVSWRRVDLDQGRLEFKPLATLVDNRVNLVIPFVCVRLAILLLLVGCTMPMGAEPVPQHRLAEVKTVSVVSLLTDQLSGSRAEGLLQAFPPAVPVPWETNEAVKATIATKLRHNGWRVTEVSYQPAQPQPATAQQHETEMVQGIARAVAQAPGAPPIDLVVVVHPVNVDRYGEPNSAARVAGSILTFGVLGAISSAIEQYRPGFVVVLRSRFEQALGEMQSCNIGFSLYVVDPRSQEIVSRKSGDMARAKLTHDIWPPDYASLSDADKHMLETTCVSGLTTTIDTDLMEMFPSAGR